MLAATIARSLSVIFESSGQLGELLEDYRMPTDGTRGKGHRAQDETQNALFEHQGTLIHCEGDQAVA